MIEIMAFLFHTVVIVIGVGLILISSDLVIKRCLEMAQRLSLSDEFIGMTVLSIGTSLPEIFTHLAASLRILREPLMMEKLSAISVGTNIGSDMFQQNFLLGLVALVGTLSVSKRDLPKDVGALIAATLLVFLFSIGGTLTRPEGAVLVLGYFIYLYVLKLYGNTDQSEIKEKSADNSMRRSVFRNVVFVLAGFIVMAVAADRVLDSAIVIVERTVSSYSFFGVLILGTATALPELSTSMIGVFRKRSAVSAGILIGSNITNPAFALGLGALISTYKVPFVIIWYDLPLKIATAVLLYFMLRKGSLKKAYAVVIMLIFAAYLFLRQTYFPTDF
jgi:cation:H+ antiporter